MSQGVVGDLWGGLERLWLGIKCLGWLLYPFAIISPVLRYMIKKQTDEQQYNEARFQSFARKFSVTTYLALEAISFIDYKGDVYLLMIVGIVCLPIAAIAWQHPDQLTSLSVLPDALVMPWIDRLDSLKKYLGNRRKGYEVGILEGDKLTKEVRQKLGIDKDTFVCEGCGVRKSVVDSWGGRLSTKAGVTHLCIECLDKAIELRRPTLERWMT